MTLSQDKLVIISGLAFWFNKTLSSLYVLALARFEKSIKHYNNPPRSFYHSVHHSSLSTIKILVLGMILLLQWSSSFSLTASGVSLQWFGFCNVENNAFYRTGHLKLGISSHSNVKTRRQRELTPNISQKGLLTLCVHSGASKLSDGFLFFTHD